MRVQVSRRAFIWIVGLMVLGILPYLGRGGWSAVLELIPGIVAVTAAILTHEGGHLLVAKLCGVRMEALRLDLLGARMVMAGLPSYTEEAATALGGPAVGFLTAAFIPLWISGGGTVKGPFFQFLLVSGMLAALNLLPVRTLDGGRALHCLVALLSPRVADALLTLTTSLCLGGLWLMAGYTLLRLGEMLSLFVFSLMLLCRLTGGEEI